MNQQQSTQPDELRRVLQEAERSQLNPAVRDLILREDLARVTINLWPQLIPRASMDPAILMKSVQDEFAASLDTSTLLQRIPAEARAGLSLPALLSHALQSDDATVRFRGGYLAIPESRRVTTIRELVITEQTLTATVTGSSDEAEYCLRQLAIMMNRAAGVERVWSDFAPHIELTAYSTSTVVDLGEASLTQMLAPSVRNFLTEEVAGPEGFASRMGGYASLSQRYDMKLIAVPALMRVEIRVGILDEVSGRTEVCNMELLTHTHIDNNRSRIKLVTELSSTEHRRFVERLVKAIQLS